MINLYPYFFSIAKKIDPELIHDFTVFFMKSFPSLGNCFRYDHISKPVRGFHITWNNPLGIAAGLDKNADTISFWNNMKLGCLEVGTVTPFAQYGNAKPRIKRVFPMSIHNSMGFPGKGSNYVYNNISKFNSFTDNSTSPIPLWVNIGKQRDTTLSSAHVDYEFLIRKFIHHCNSIVVNISSPNTKDLRDLQGKNFLSFFLDSLRSTRDLLRPDFPLILKISPNEENSFYQDLPSLISKYNWQGIVATNTSNQHDYNFGGISGEKLFDLSYNIAKAFSIECFKYKIDYIFAGGITGRKSIEKLIQLPIKFFQIYTGLIYNGPFIFQELFEVLSYNDPNRTL